ncbi:AAA-domain-containing protein [Aulographum hederae CBS 113979]|uniref:AAA-domain-containing protein n=1 Tax=Aulographum hederae CBS 113979 TaxID=1176131 RepID=A0A6G1H378_9PEZI|nr:AAA-domain-containing protein [Aulographum hederae CBS 113979]
MASATAIKPALHVEVRVLDVPGTIVRTDSVQKEVVEWLSTQFLSLRIDQEVKGYEKLQQSAAIDSIKVVDCSANNSETSIYKLDEVRLDVQTYILYNGEDGNSRSSSDDGNDEDSPHFNISQLPSKKFVGLWDSLVFDRPTPATLLRFITRMMTIASNPELDQTLLNWNRLLLLHGPPGTGKTTLCRALAQKLTIRLGGRFTHGKLVEINSPSMLSKWFGESSRLVGKMFEGIHALADDETTLVCILIDEVESLTGMRERVASGNEVGDALRATNQVLTGLDRIKHRSNVMVFCTSNLLSAIDSAFLDRVDIKQFIPNPCASAAYQILRTCFNEFVRCGILVSSEDPQDIADPSCTVSADLNFTMSDWVFMDYEYFPTLQQVNFHLWNRPHSPGRKLWSLAQRAEGLSGRELRRLAFKALALHTFADPTTVLDGLSALARVLDDEHPSFQRENGKESNQYECR